MRRASCLLNRILGRETRIPSLLALTTLLLAFGLRVYRLDAQSFAFDEGWTSYAIHHSWPEMWRVLAPDNHPPLYYLVVKAFAEIAGYGDFSVRMVSVLSGTVLVATLHRLGRALFGSIGGLAAAILAACSPLLIYYAQEARMYSVLMALVTLSSYSLLRLARRAQRARPARSSSGFLSATSGLAAYVLSTAGALYTHYFAALILLAHNVAVVVWLLAGRRDLRGLPTPRRPGRRSLVRWLLAQLAIGILYLPWLPVAIRQVAIGQGTWWRVPLPAKMIAKDLWRFLILGPRRPVEVPVVGLALGGMAALVVVALLGTVVRIDLKGLGRTYARRPLGSSLYVLALWLVPLAAIVIAGSRELRFAWPIYTDRYALVAAPGLVLTAGMGVATSWQMLARPDRSGKIPRFAQDGLCQVASLFLLAAAVAGPLPHLSRYYHDPSYWREDFRRAAQYAMDTTGPGDAVVLLGSYQPVMQYYRGEATVVRFPQQGDSVQDEAAVVRALDEAVTPASQVRLVMYSWPTVDPQGLVEGALRAGCRLQGEHWQRETGQRPIRVLNWAECAPFAVQSRQALDAVFDEQLALTAYRAMDVRTGAQAHVLLWWRTLRRPERNYSAFVHLVGGDGQIITQFDHLPLSDFYPMQAWPVGVDHRDDYPLNIPSDADLEEAWLAIGLYDRASDVRLPVRVDGEPCGDAVRIPLDTDPKGLGDP
jgi:mannosyltransferase